MLFRTVVLIGFVFSLAALPGWASSTSKEAEYLGGSVKSIPVKTVGSLNLDDREELQFKTAEATVRVPYTRIKTVNFSRAKSSARKVGPVPLPKLPLLHHVIRRDQLLDLSYRDEGGHICTMSFRLTGKALSSAEFTLSERMDSNGKPAQTAGRQKLPEAWWGDKYWKTTRNKGTWPETETVGTK